MNSKCSCLAVIAMLATAVWLGDADSSFGQQRYQPSRPTVSPYLNLFRFNDSVVPNYQSLVRPQQDALRFRQQQQQYDRQQSQALNQLQTSVQVLQQPGVTTEFVAPTGKGAWFNRQGGATFQDTLRFYSQTGSAAAGTATGTPAAAGQRR